jgi:hypothetical protein
MLVTNKITGEDVTPQYLGLLKGMITRDEFNTITGIGNVLLKNQCEIVR